MGEPAPSSPHYWRFDAVSSITASAITGTSESDIWFTRSDTLYHYDGTTTQQVDTRICAHDTNPAYRMDVSAIHVDEKGIALYGSVPAPGEFDSGSIRALATRPRAGGKWRCRSEGPSFNLLLVGACGSSFWQLSYLPQGILRFGDRPLPGPPASCDFNTTFWRSCAGPVWVALNLETNTASPEVWEWTGGTWRSLGAPPDFVKALYGVESGALWGVGMRNWSNDNPTGDGDTLLRYEQGKWRRLPTPPGFTAYFIVGEGPERVWFLGKGQATRWTPGGLDLRALPFDYVTATWFSPSGVLWISGEPGIGRLVEEASEARPSAPFPRGSVHPAP